MEEYMAITALSTTSLVLVGKGTNVSRRKNMVKTTWGKRLGPSKENGMQLSSVVIMWGLF